MVDIHSHILPMIDDGSDSFSETIEMLKLASRYNVRHIVASSHGNIDMYSYSIEQYREVFLRLQAEIRRRELNVKIYPGMEILLDGDVVDGIESGKLLTINETNYVLVEVPFEVGTNYIIENVKKLVDAGCRVILAHPERYAVIKAHPERAEELVKAGCTLQVNTGSIAGVFGKNCQRTALSLMDMGMVSLIATDAHDSRMRSHDMRGAMEILEDRYEPELIHMWTSENPSRVLKGMELIKDIEE